MYVKHCSCVTSALHTGTSECTECLFYAGKWAVVFTCTNGAMFLFLSLSLRRLSPSELLCVDQVQVVIGIVVVTVSTVLLLALSLLLCRYKDLFWYYYYKVQLRGSFKGHVCTESHWSVCVCVCIEGRGTEGLRMSAFLHPCVYFFIHFGIIF